MRQENDFIILDNNSINLDYKIAKKYDCEAILRLDQVLCIYPNGDIIHLWLTEEATRYGIQALGRLAWFLPALIVAKKHSLPNSFFLEVRHAYK